MKIHLIKKQTVEDFVEVHIRSKTSFEEWFEKLRQAKWEKPTDIKTTFGTADLLGKSSNRVVFSIGGDAYRIICKYFFLEKSRCICLFVRCALMQNMIK